MANKMHRTKKGAGGPKQSRRIRRLAVLSLGVLALLVFMVPELARTAQPSRPAVSSLQSRKVLEELNYQVDVWLWRHAVKGRVEFKELAPGRYRAEVRGTTQGFLAFISGNWNGRLSTEMQLTDGKLLPIIYREESQSRGQKKLSEYRFDYAQGKVELWKLKTDKTMEKRWETTFTEPMYDPLTFFYSRRLTGKPIGKGGETLKFQGIPYPRPDEIVLRVGTATPEGRKVMLDLESRIFKDERTQLYAFINNEGIPTKAWTRVLMFGNIDIKLLSKGKRLKKEEVAAFRKQARLPD